MICIIDMCSDGRCDCMRMSLTARQRFETTCFTVSRRVSCQCENAPDFKSEQSWTCSRVCLQYYPASKPPHSLPTLMQPSPTVRHTKCVHPLIKCLIFNVGMWHRQLTRGKWLSNMQFVSQLFNIAFRMMHVFVHMCAAIWLSVMSMHSM